MPIRFRCPHCKKPLQVKDHLAGKKAPCPACKKGLVIPSAPTPSASATVPPVKSEQAPAPVVPPANLEELAAAAFTDEPATNGKQEEVPANIEFICEFCEAPIQAPFAEAGKRMQCPNPECRRLVKVPLPKAEKPKDWRELAKKGPTVAQMMQQEKIDDAAWGTQTDKVRAGSASLMEAGAIAAPKAAPIGVRGWTTRVLWTTGVALALVVAVFAANRARVVSGDKGFASDMLRYLEPDKGGKPAELIKDPVVRAEGYRAIGEYKIRHDSQYKAIDPLKQALAVLSQPAGKVRPIEYDLFLIDLALTIAELGGSDDDEIAKEKWSWKGRELPKLLQSTLDAIKAPEAKVIALRALSTRLLEKEQAALATGLASQLSNPESGRGRPPATSQLVALLKLQKKAVSELVDEPGLPKKSLDLLTRVGFAEFHARTGDFGEAMNLADFNGPAQDKLEACVGVAQVVLSSKKPNLPDAGPFVDKALEIAEKQKVSPWLLLQTIRVAARVKGNAAVPVGLLKKLPPAFQPRGYLELVLAAAAASHAGPLGVNILADLQTANSESPSLDFGWEALARQNARVGSSEVFDESRQDENARFRPMTYIGKNLGDWQRE
jgi:hypothetical protein